MADTGRGIPPDRLETVFDRFSQEEGAISSQIITGWGGRRFLDVVKKPSATILAF